MLNRRVAGGILVVAVASIGCNQSTLPPKASVEEARATLTVALDAWKRGETAEALARRDPPIYFNDLKPDTRLVDFSVADGHEWYGQSVRLTAVLMLKMPDGGTKERKVTYLIDTAPALVIVPG